MEKAKIPMRQLECYSCHMVWWMPTSFYDQCREQKPHKQFWCPAGHQQHFVGESDLDKERRERQRLAQANARLEEEARRAIVERNTAVADLKRHKTRAKAGLCPCCNRSFVNMQRHMKSKHPDYNVVPIKAEA